MKISHFDDAIIIIAESKDEELYLKEIHEFMETFPPKHYDYSYRPNKFHKNDSPRLVIEWKKNDKVETLKQPRYKVVYMYRPVLGGAQEERTMYQYFYNYNRAAIFAEDNIGTLYEIKEDE